MLLTEQEVIKLWDSHTVPVFGKSGINPVVFATLIEAELLERLKAQEPYAIEVSEDNGDSFELVYPAAVMKYNMFPLDQVTRLLYEHPLPPADVVRDAERLDWLQSNCRCDPMMDGQHKWWPTNFNKCLTGPSIREAIDAAMKEMK